MKKIIMLLLGAGIFTASYAQGYKNYKKNYEHEQGTHAVQDRTFHKQNVYRSNSYQKQKQVEKIDREFKADMWAIQHNRYMSNRQKRLSIRDAKKEREYKMKMISNNSYGYANNNYGKNYGR